MAITAATWSRIDGIGLDQAIDATSSTQVYKAGMKIRCRDMSSTTERGEATFQYAKGVASVVAGDMCVISPNNDAAIRTVARSKGQLGVAMAAIVASNWGWFQVEGTAVCNVAASFADDLAVYLTATDGVVDDAVVTGDLVYGARSAGAISGSQALVDIRFPFAGDTDNS